MRERKSTAKNYRQSRIRWVRADNLRPKDLVFDTQGKPWEVKSINIQEQNIVTGVVGLTINVTRWNSVARIFDIHYVHAQTRYRTQRFISDEALMKRARRASNK